jgi:dihydroxyacetone kinase-like predicted kinase
MYLLDAADERVPDLRKALAELGDSLLVVGGDGLWNVHVHVDDVGAAVEAGIEAGRPHRIVVTHFRDQVAAQSGAVERAGRAVVAVAPGEGLAELYESTGAVVVRSPIGAKPATRDVLRAIERAGTPEVVVLPHDSDVLAVAEAAADQARGHGTRVAVIPTRASVQVLAALAVHDAGRRFDDDVVGMTAAARATRSGSVTLATREALTSAGVCQPGDVLGMVEGDVAVIGADVAEVARSILDRLLGGGGELTTLVLGAEAGDGLAPLLLDHLRQTHPEVETTVYDGGQTHYPLLVGVE